MLRKTSSKRLSGAFTLLELLVASAVLLIILVLLLQITGGMGEIWKSSVGKITTYQSARAAFSTITRTLSRTTLNTYFDYVDVDGAARTPANAATFVPRNFARASELHFLAGPTRELISDASATANPGHAIFFQVPSGETNSEELRPLNQTLNSVGFYIQYGPLDDNRLIPSWIQSLLGSTYRYRVVQLVEPAEDMGVYLSTSETQYDDSWLSFFSTNRSASLPRARVLAENVPLLVFRARLSPVDEESIAGRMGLSYTPESLGSILSPNYHYDSRAWQGGYPAGRVPNLGSTSLNLRGVMRNQAPPIVDVAMVAVDERSIVRLNPGASPPEQLTIPPVFFKTRPSSKKTSPPTAGS
jgi:uncharacterized protein (TIGR02599 family)